MSSLWICVDASLVIRLVADPADEAVRRLWEGWDADGRLVAAPTLLYYEVTNGLFQYQRLGLLTSDAVQLAQQAALSLPISLHGQATLHRRALGLAGGLVLPATYDAHYLALAEALDAEFWTADKRLVHAVRETLPWVHAAT